VCTTPLLGFASFAVGTAIIEPRAGVCEEGRLLIFQVDAAGTLKQIHCSRLKGDVACLRLAKDRLVVALKGKVRAGARARIRTCSGLTASQVHVCSVEMVSGTCMVNRLDSIPCCFQLVDLDVLDTAVLTADLVRSASILRLEQETVQPSGVEVPT